MTAHIDIILDFNKDNLNQFQKVVNDFGYQQMIFNLSIEKLSNKVERLELINTKNLIVYNYLHTQISKMS